MRRQFRDFAGQEDGPLQLGVEGALGIVVDGVAGEEDRPVDGRAGRGGLLGHHFEDPDDAGVGADRITEEGVAGGHVVRLAGFEPGAAAGQLVADDGGAGALQGEGGGGGLRGAGGAQAELAHPPDDGALDADQTLRHGLHVRGAGDELGRRHHRGLRRWRRRLDGG